VARRVVPAAAGIGTHTQLGLPPCGLWLWLHIPCPACGLTTAWAHLARGELFASLAVHPLGLPLFGLCALLVLRALFGLLGVGSLTGSPLAWLLHPIRQRAALGLTLSLALVWLARLVSLAGATTAFH
jgi:hypothetical protein